MTNKNKGGRPKSYSDAQVDYAIEQAEKQDLPVGVETVKPILCTEFGISSGINGQSLEKAILERVEVRADQNARDLLEKLPTEAMDAAGEISEQFRHSLVGFLAQTFEGLRTEAGAKEAAKEEDLRNTRARVRDLEAELATRDQAIAALEVNAEGLQEKLAAKTQEVANLRAQIEQQSRDAVQTDMVMEMVKEAVAGAINDTDGQKPTKPN